MWQWYIPDGDDGGCGCGDDCDDFDDDYDDDDGCNDGSLHFFCQYHTENTRHASKFYLFRLF